MDHGREDIMLAFEEEQIISRNAHRTTVPLPNSTIPLSMCQLTTQTQLEPISGHKHGPDHVCAGLIWYPMQPPTFLEKGQSVLHIPKPIRKGLRWHLPLMVMEESCKRLMMIWKLSNEGDDNDTVDDFDSFDD